MTIALAAAVAAAAAVDRARAEERTFLVILAHSPKAFFDPESGNGGPPTGGFVASHLIKSYYFERPDSFAEYWEEVSYRKVTISGDVVDWTYLPWSVDPIEGVDDNPDPRNYINLRVRTLNVCLNATPTDYPERNIPTPYGYGAGEEFCDCTVLPPGDRVPDITPAKCGAMIIYDFHNDPDVPEFRGAGMDDFAETGFVVWTPGERFLDLDGDRRWDALDEKNDMMCYGPDGCEGDPPGIGPRGCDEPGCGDLVFPACDWGGRPPLGEFGFGRPDRNIQGGLCSDQTCEVALDVNGDLVDCGAAAGDQPGERFTCNPTETNLAPCCKCETPDSQNAACCLADGTCEDRSLSDCCPEDGNRFHVGESCDNYECGQQQPPEGACCLLDGGCEDSDIIACTADRGDFILGAMCADDPCGECVAGGIPGLTCDATNEPECQVEGCGIENLPDCCEYDDCTNEDSKVDYPEPFEDYMVRWNPTGATPPSVWVPVDDDYIANNYPGIVDNLKEWDLQANPKGRTANGWFDSPDLYSDNVNKATTKMMQDAGNNRFTTAVPKPGDSKASSAPISPGYEIEEAWYEQMWLDRYSTTPPPWPTGGYGPREPEGCPDPPDGRPECAPAPAQNNSPRMLEFKAEDPIPYGVDGDEETSRRWFAPNKGGWNGNGTGTVDDPFATFYSDDNDSEVLPEEEWGYYDGWVEHDDLPSSKYHHAGDQRLGEITYPARNTATIGGFEYPLIWGWDDGTHTPGRPQMNGDRIGVAAGPYATNATGINGFDAGDVAILEWLTWRNGLDGTLPDDTASKGNAWGLEREYAGGPRPFYHPFASPPPGKDMGFRDYNLDGMIDQGETRPVFSENYTTDSITQQGTTTDYPWNRQRMMEDLVEALDYSYDWGDYADEFSMRQVLCPGDVTYAFGSDPIDNYPVPDRIRFEKPMQSTGFQSGIVLLPEDSYGPEGAQRFPLSPLFYPIHNSDNDDPRGMFPDWENQRLKSENGRLVYRKDNGDCYNPHPYSPDPPPPSPLCYPAVTISHNLWFHDLVIALGVSGEENQVEDEAFQLSYAAHEYMHAWEKFPDLYDYDVFDEGGPLINCPIGAWDIMASGGLVHPSPFLKAFPCTAWIQEEDITTLLTPGVSTNRTIANYEFNRNQVLYIQNPRDIQPEGGRERFWLWSQTHRDSPFDTRLPGPGVMIQRTNNDENMEGREAQQRRPPFQFVNIQADGLGELDDGTDCGDAGDPWPGTRDPENPGNNPATEWNADTIPNNNWVTFNSSSGLEIEDIRLDPGSGAASVQFNWTPQTVPSLKFVQPPGGSSVFGVFTVLVSAVDVFGATSIYVYWTHDPNDVTVDPNRGNFVGSVRKTRTGRETLEVPWDVSNLPDGEYYLFGRLIPTTDDGIEQRSEPDVGKSVRPNRRVDGIGTLEVKGVNTGRVVTDGVAPPPVGGFALTRNTLTDDSGSFVAKGVQVGNYLDIVAAQEGYLNVTTGVHRITAVTPNTLTTASSLLSSGNSSWAGRYQVITHTNTSRLELWTITAGNGGQTWTVVGSISGAQLAVAQTGQDYTTDDDELSFKITEGSVGFRTEDQFVVITTGVSASSVDVSVRGGEVSEGPRPVILATPLSGLPPLLVRFDGRESYDPEGRPLSFTWTFGDGSPSANGAQVQHTYTDPGQFTVTLKATNNRGKIGEAQLDIVVANNPPNAFIKATPTSGPEPLQVAFDGTASSDPEGSPLSFEWDFGDGSPASEEPVIEHTYFRPCTNQNNEFRPCQASLKVCDDGGECDLEFKDILVGNTNPVAVVKAEPLLGSAPLDVTFNASRSFDPDGDVNLTVDWDYNTDGKVDESGPINRDYVHTYVENGSYRATATVRDARFGAGKTSVTINVFESGPNIEQPVAKFVVDPEPPQGEAPFEVRVDGSQSRDLQGPIVTYTWEWGDGTENTLGVRATHVYQRAGTFKLKLTVIDTDNNSHSRTRTVLVTGEGEGGEPEPPGNRPPVAVINIDQERGPAPLTVRFNGGSSTDADGDVLTYAWDFGDGTTATGREVIHTYEQQGTYFARLTVEDGNGGRSVRTQRIVVEPPLFNRAPAAFIASGRRTGTAPLVLTFRSASVDPDGDPLSYLWEFWQVSEDGRERVGEDVSGAEVTFRFDDPARYEVILTVTDPAGVSDTTPPEIVTVTARVEPPAENGNDNDGEPTPPQTTPPRFCAFGMMSGLVGTLLGLASMLAARRRFRF